LKIIVVYDKNGEIKSVASPAENLTGDVFMEAPADHTVLELKSDDLVRLTDLAKDDITLDDMEKRKLRLMNSIYERCRIDTERRTITYRKPTS
jgi:hypothetical protein